jgi:2-polyprenyl-3-methyl-5-hydroxy-6-metoxy-1,4-benzoquinol methylase
VSPVFRVEFDLQQKSGFIKHAPMPEPTPDQHRQDIPPLICPDCRGTIDQDGSTIHCSACDFIWPIQSGIYNFLASGGTGIAQSENHLNEFNRIASDQGWQAAAETIASKSTNPAHHLEYITSEARADFRFLLPVTPDDIVLDVCGGWGNMTAAFARTCKHVFTLDTSWEQQVFSSLRASQEGLHNITFLRANPNEIPLPEDSCQVAVLADTLECGSWQQASENSRQNHPQILRSIWEKLVPGGCLYLGVENRYSYKYVLGGKVPLSNLRFISLLPHSLANRYSHLVHHTNYQEITYSQSGITKILQQAGFSNFKVLYPIPAYPKFRFMTDLNSRAATKFMISRLRLHSGFNKTFYFFSRVASSLGILPWFAPGLSIIAYKG